MSKNDPRMTEPVIVCPNCKTEIKLTESLAAPLIESTRKQFEQQLSEKDAEIARRVQSLRDKEKQVVDAKRTLEQQVVDQVEREIKEVRRAGTVALILDDKLVAQKEAEIMTV